ncbi:MAG: V-type ATP synthase subunit I [Candidatus Coproplasma sp.]
MAIAEMSKLKLVAMSYDRDKILNALQRTNATEIKLQYEDENTVAMSSDCEQLKAYLSSLEEALAYVSAATETYNKENKVKSDVLQDGFEISYSEFMSAKDKKEETDALVKSIKFLEERKKGLESELVGLRRTISSAEIYSAVNAPLNGFKGTLHTKIRLGTISAPLKEDFFKAIEEEPLSACSVINSDEDNVLILAAGHKSSEQFDKILQSFSFIACPFDEELTGEEYYASLKGRESTVCEQLKEVESQTYALNTSIRSLKIYCDYVGFELEKAEASNKLRSTQATFILEAYVPKEAEEAVKEALSGVTDAIYYEFTQPTEEDTPPTLYKNNAVVKNFETITNTYSPVSYREFDPNAVMSFFYSLFLGFIMGDIGYGLLMIIGGGFIYFKKRDRDSGLRRLSGVFAVGGVFAVIWGILFNSLFGLSLPFLPTVMPDAQSDMWSFMGIKVPAVLIISLELGVLQLMAGYLCRAWQCWRRRQIADGIFDGVVWAVFSVGVGIAVIGLIDEANVSVLAMVGGIIAGGSLLVAVLTAGRKEKLLGKFTKGFGAAYGIINYLSDVLSYARLYGLMLSGAVIAQIVSQYSVQFITGGNPGLIILGVVLMLVGHIFNLAIGLLGAYIHDARLQYVEFYGRFYEGEGELFSPLGSQHKYVYLPLGAAAKR